MLLRRCVKAILFAVALAAVGCAVDEQPEGFGDDLGTTESPVPTADAYRVATRVQIALDLPALTTAIANLRAFSQGGGHALLGHSGSVPAWVATLSTTLRNNLEGYIDAELDKIKLSNKTLRQVTGELATIAQTVLSTFTIESSLSISPTAVVHSLLDLNFTPSNVDIVVPIGGLNADEILQRPTASVGVGGALTIGEQRFGLAFGSHAWQAINLASTTLYGGDLSIIAGIDCGGVARAVAAKCVSGSCVGHATEIESACKIHLASLVDDVRANVTPIEIGDIHLASGAAKLVDDGTDGLADRIVDGTWDAEVDMGDGARAVTATFDGFD
jgi:hypothetical protein